MAVALAALVGFVGFAIVHKEQAAPSKKVPDEDTGVPMTAPAQKAAPAAAAAEGQSATPAAAPATAAGGISTEPQSYQYVMDYKSVFALKHNVLDQDAQSDAAMDDAPVDDKNVHFVLHE